MILIKPVVNKDLSTITFNLTARDNLLKDTIDKKIKTLTNVQLIKPAILYSSGLESYTNAILFYYLHKKYPELFGEPLIIHFNYGQAAAEVEKRLTEKFIADYNIKNYEIVDAAKIYELLGVNIAKLDEQYSNNETNTEARGNSHYYPYRNSLFIILSAIIAERYNYNLIVLGGNLTESMTYGDNTNEFILGADVMTRFGGANRIYTTSPLIYLTKSSLIILGQLLGANYDEYSSSCYYPKFADDSKIVACNKCGSCYLRNKAFERAEKLKKRYRFELSF